MSGLAQVPSNGRRTEGGPGKGTPARTAPTQHPESTVYSLMVRRLASRLALWVGAIWGFAEAFLFFVVPDAWLGLVALYAPRRMPATLLAIVLGASGGAVFLYLATPIPGESLTDIIVGLPGLSRADLEQVHAELAVQGPAAFLNGVLQALPLKLYVHASALDGIGLPEVLVFTVLNRIERLLVFGLVMALLGWLGRPVVARWPRASAVAYVAAWVIFYTGFWLTTGA